MSPPNLDEQEMRKDRAMERIDLENKSKLQEEAMENIFGGDGNGSYAMVCSGCGKFIAYTDVNEFLRHILYCKGNPDE